MKTKPILSLGTAWLLGTFSSLAQDCSSSVDFRLLNIRGGVFSNQSVTLTSLTDGATFTEKSNSTGVVHFDLPCNQIFDIAISNYTEKEQVTSRGNGSRMTRTLTYEPNMAEMDAQFAMSPSEQKQVDALAQKLPDTTRLVNGLMKTPPMSYQYELVTIKIKDLNNGPLSLEDVRISGTKRNKHFVGKTNSKGEMRLYLPKGDDYTLNFQYQPAYKEMHVKYNKGTATSSLEISYMGTKEYLRRKKVEEERIKAEEKRLAEEKAAFDRYCKERKVSLEEGFKLKMKEKEATGDPEEHLLETVFKRNNWKNKLIVCDLTGSMDPYARQLAVWYQLNLQLEKGLQFVFFNDGDSKRDAEKVIGSTGGIYYQKAKGIDSLIDIMSTVRSHGNGGDCAENDLEAILKGEQLAQNYQELILIADNNAPVKDISLLKQLKKPVHIILCGSYRSEILADYLLIAWQTKGSVHTMEEDILKLAAMAEGGTIKIGGYEYKIMGGKFVLIQKT